MLISICGPACSGKDTIAKELTEYKRIIQHTTRPKRPGEVEGVDYYYHPSKSFAVEPCCFKTFKVANGEEWCYWFELSDIREAIESNEIFITITDGNNSIQLLSSGAKVVFINTAMENRIKRYYERESKKESPDYKEAMRRLISDIDDFDPFYYKYEIVSKVKRIDNNDDINYAINGIKEYLKSLK